MPSRTAMVTAAHRADHQTLECGAIFQDPLALQMIGEHISITAHTDVAANAMRKQVRLYLAARARVAEDAVAEAVTGGTRQIIILGAGLDTLAYRHPYGPTLQVFEVDFPASQLWKLHRLRAAGITIPANVHHVPVDFEHTDFMTALIQAGYDPASPALFLWLGVIYYLPDETGRATLAAIAEQPGATTLVMDYLEPLSHMPAGQQSAMREVTTRVAALGESLITFHPRADMVALARAAGFSQVDDIAKSDVIRKHMPEAGLPEGGSSRMLVARK